MTDPVARRREALVLGAAAEQQVARALEADGWTICARNWLGGGGELDVVAERNGAIQLVEVKARALGDFVGLEVVGPAKQRKMSRAASAWLCGWDGPFEQASFTVVLVQGGELSWILDAFDEVR
jgi:Holliday junction resolvase-like predicted endonuclease